MAGSNHGTGLRRCNCVALAAFMTSAACGALSRGEIRTMAILPEPAADAVLTVATPLKRRLAIAFRGERIVSSRWLALGERVCTPKDQALPAVAARVQQQLSAYFARKLDLFDLPLEYCGSAFDQKIWRVVSTIPFGVTASYGEVARVAGHPGAHRGVARAMGTIGFALFIPAHRVIGADGRIKGADGESMRVRLFEFEGC